MAGENEGHEPAQARQGFLNSFRQHNAQIADPDADLEDALHQALEPYHSQLIALGSAIGTGLFIGSGQGLAIAGPIPLLFAFSFVGFTLCPTILALGEMATLIPKPGGFFHHTRVFVHEGWAAAMGWKFVIPYL
jgi:amino acid transporter